MRSTATEQKSAPQVSNPTEITPKTGHYYESHQILLADLKSLDKKYKFKLLTNIPKPAEDSWMCHLYAASYVLQWLYENEYVFAKPFPVRNRDAHSEAEAKTPHYTKKTKPKTTKKNSVLSMRSIAKALGLSTVGEFMNGDEICSVINACKTEDPKQAYTAKNLQVTDKAEYIKTIRTNIDNNLPPIVVYDFDRTNEIGEFKGEHEHSTVIAGYVQSENDAAETQFILVGHKGYVLMTADALFSSTSQLEPKYYAKEKADFRVDNKDREISPDDELANAKMLETYRNVDSVKVSMKGPYKSWWPVTKLSFFLKYMQNPADITNGLIPKKDQKKIVADKDDKGWKNTIVLIHPDKTTDNTPRLR